jgi:hypothetical protein
MNDAGPALAIRDELLGSVERWQATLPEDDAPPTTLWVGVAVRASALASALLKLAVAEFARDVPLPDKPTLGALIQALDQRARHQRATCLGVPRALLRPTEIQLLRRLSRMRASVVHQEDGSGSWEAALIGRLTVADTREFLDVAGKVARLPLIEELICRERARPDPTSNEAGRAFGALPENARRRPDIAGATPEGSRHKASGCGRPSDHSPPRRYAFCLLSRA